jgi:methylmalonyl-CoA mutase
VRDKRQENAARRKDAITGTSDYPNLHEEAARVLDVKPVAKPKEAGAKPSIEPLPSIRLAEPFEALRDASDRFLTKTGARPRVFLANLGTPSDFTARATFAKNFYEAGGIEAVSNDGFKDQAAMLAAFKTSGARLACLCSSDKVYEAQAAEAAKALSAAGAIVQVAGRGGDHEAAWRQAGVKTFVFMGCDALSTLRETHGILALK